MATAIIGYVEVSSLTDNGLFVRNSRQWRIGPEVLQVVELAHVRHKDMHHHIAIVHGHPQRTLQTYHTGRLLIQLLAHPVANALGDGFHLRGRTSLANHKTAADGALYATEVGHYDVVAFLFLYSLNYGFY